MINIAIDSLMAQACYDKAIELKSFRASTILMMIPKHMQSMTDEQELNSLFEKWVREGVATKSTAIGVYSIK